jgi:tRNA threonylcarbamoyladenosine biosynthesis protein TsaB
MLERRFGYKCLETRAIASVSLFSINYPNSHARYNAGMNFAAFETSSETVSIAVSRGGQIYSRDIANSAKQNAELALPTLHALLAEAKMTMADIDAGAYGQGPGSFTGVRIACGLAQGLAFGLGKGVIGVTSLMLLAAQADADNVIVAIDARMGEIYLAVYEKCEKNDSAPMGYVEVIAPMLVRPDALADLVLPSHDYVGIGSAFDVPELATQIQVAAGEKLKRIIVGAFPRALDLIHLASRQVEMIGQDALRAPQDAAPIYLRNNVAMTIAEREIFHAAKNAKLAQQIKVSA